MSWLVMEDQDNTRVRVDLITAYSKGDFEGKDHENDYGLQIHLYQGGTHWVSYSTAEERDVKFQELDEINLVYLREEKEVDKIEYTVKDILFEWLELRGYSGLYNEEEECGCEIEDLCPCNLLESLECRPGYKVNLEECDHGSMDHSSIYS